jgi:hypothetical protein
MNLDEQIEQAERDLRHYKSDPPTSVWPIYAEILASLREYQQIKQAEMPEEPEFDITDDSLSARAKWRDYADALRAVALRNAQDAGRWDCYMETLFVGPNWPDGFAHAQSRKELEDAVDDAMKEKQ